MFCFDLKKITPTASGVSRNREKGGPRPRGAAPGGGGMSKYFFRMPRWQPLPVENHLLHNEVAQIGIEGEKNTEAVWPLRCCFWRHACQSQDRWVSNSHGNPVNSGHANVNLHAHYHSRKSTEGRLSYQVALKVALNFSSRTRKMTLQHFLNGPNQTIFLKSRERSNQRKLRENGLFNLQKTKTRSFFQDIYMTFCTHIHLTGFFHICSSFFKSKNSSTFF